MTPPIKLLGKLHKIMEAVDYIQKDKKNQHQGYSYASEKVIKEALHAAFVANKVIMQVSTRNPQIVGSSFCIEVCYAFYDVDSGETIEGTFVGTGQTRDEKGNYAAVTGAIKYILTSFFLIATGDDPENDEADRPAKPPRTKTNLTPPVPAPATAEQIQSIKSLAKQLGMTVEEVLAVPAKELKLKNLTIETITPDLAAGIISGLQKKLVASKAA